MRKRVIFLVCAAVLLLFLCSFLADAGENIYINGSADVLQQRLGACYAIGGSGTALLGTDSVHILTASGVQTLESDAAVGGGGLVSVGGTVAIRTDIVKVSLRYYYSDDRDSSMTEARLENAVGSGYAFGYLDENRAFVPYDETSVTDVRTLSIRPDDAGGVEIYNTETEELLYAVPNADRNSYLVIHPLSPDAESVTWFARKRYYGDFAYADIGNGRITVLNILPMERYLLGVCDAEMGGGFPLEALKAQAVAARTYAASYIGGAYRAYGFDLTSDTYSQAYTGYTEDARIRQAVAETENLYLTYRGSLINALYFAADGGEFPNALPYLRGYPDPYEESVWRRGASGHRVGMSQWGACAMAQVFGKNYQEILGFYYTGVGLSYGVR
jgi:hypothetical protein